MPPSPLQDHRHHTLTLPPMLEREGAPSNLQDVQSEIFPRPPELHEVLVAKELSWLAAIPQDSSEVSTLPTPLQSHVG